MKKTYLFTLVFVIAGAYAIAQPSTAIEWQKIYGGTMGEFATSVEQTSDGGYITAGTTLSDDGDISNNHGGFDYWVVKLNSSGAIVWQKSLGGSGSDVTYSPIKQTSDGGYILSGYSNSDDGDVSGNHGGLDYWIVKLNDTGNIEWQKSLGGSADDESFSIQQTTDGGYITAGYSESDDGDVSGNHGSDDMWIVKLNSSGNIEWQKSLGGSGDEIAFSIKQTLDGGYVVAGGDRSNDGDVSNNRGDLDFWIVKLNNEGTLQWQKSFGGSFFDEAYSIDQTSDGGYIVTGETSSSDGDVKGLHGGTDEWIIRLDADGNMQWQKCLGGSDYDIGSSVKQTNDGGYIAAGTSDSHDGDVSGVHGEAGDCWIVRLNSTGDLQWQLCLGGSNSEDAWSIDKTSDGGYIVGGSSSSSDGDISNNYGGDDYWVVKLKPDNILPITMLALTGKAQGKQNILNWTTATEQNNTGFEVQRSSDGYSFSKVGFVNTKAVNGSSNLKLSYDFSDIGFAASANYYRLKQIDKDDKFTLSNIVLLRDGNAPAIGDVSIYPNPAKNIVTVKIALANSDNIKLAVTDMSGKTIFTKSVLAGNGETIVQVDASRLSPGSYFIKVISGNGKENVVKKFVKE